MVKDPNATVEKSIKLLTLHMGCAAGWEHFFTNHDEYIEHAKRLERSPLLY